VLAEVSLLLEESVEVLEELSVEVMVGTLDESVAEVEPVEVTEPVEEPVAEPVKADPVAVPVAPWMPKLGEKLMLLGLVSSMISIVYWKELTSAAAGILRVAVPPEAGMALAKVMPPSGVTGCCCSLMVTVPLDGLVH